MTQVKQPLFELIFFNQLQQNNMNQFQKDISDKKEALKEAHTSLVEESEKHPKDTLLFLSLNSQAAGIWDQICLLDQVDALYGQHHASGPAIVEPASPGKTIVEWLGTLDEPYRTQALANCHPHNREAREPSLSKAIIRGFDWEFTPQSPEYWNSLYEKVRRAE